MGIFTSTLIIYSTVLVTYDTNIIDIIVCHLGIYTSIECTNIYLLVVVTITEYDYIRIYLISDIIIVHGVIIILHEATIKGSYLKDIPHNILVIR